MAGIVESTNIWQQRTAPPRQCLLSRSLPQQSDVNSARLQPRLQLSMHARTHARLYDHVSAPFKVDVCRDVPEVVVLGLQRGGGVHN